METPPGANAGGCRGIGKGDGPLAHQRNQLGLLALRNRHGGFVPQRLEMAGRVDQRVDQLAFHRMRVRMIAKPEGQRLALFPRNMSVPNIQSHSARHEPKFLLKCFGLDE